RTGQHNGSRRQIHLGDRQSEGGSEGLYLLNVGRVGAITGLCLALRETRPAGDDIGQRWLLLPRGPRSQRQGDLHHFVGIERSCLGRAQHRLALAARKFHVFVESHSVFLKDCQITRLLFTALNRNFRFSSQQPHTIYPATEATALFLLWLGPGLGTGFEPPTPVLTRDSGSPQPDMRSSAAVLDRRCR